VSWDSRLCAAPCRIRRATRCVAVRSAVDEGAFAYPKERKEPLTDASHVRNAMLDQLLRDGCSTCFAALSRNALCDSGG
jgi:hypothetical protein